MARDDALTDADAQYLAQIWEDCEECLGPGTDVLDLRRETADEGLRLVVRYRLGEHEHESAAAADTMLAAHTVLRARILFDRMRFGLSDIIERR